MLKLADNLTIAILYYWQEARPIAKSIREDTFCIE